MEALSCCSSSEKVRWTMIGIASLSAVTFLVLNILAVSNHISAPAIGSVNLLAFGAIAITSVIYLLSNFEELSQRQKAAALTAFVFFSILTALSALGCANVFKASTVGWTLFVPLITVAGLAALFAAYRYYNQSQEAALDSSTDKL